MDSCFATFKANVQTVQAYTSGNNGFLGKKIGGSVNSISTLPQLWKSFATQKTNTMKIKPGIASVLTSDINDYTVVSSLLCYFRGVVISYMCSFMCRTVDLCVNSCHSGTY